MAGGADGVSKAQPTTGRGTGSSRAKSDRCPHESALRTSQAATRQLSSSDSAATRASILEVASPDAAGSRSLPVFSRHGSYRPRGQRPAHVIVGGLRRTAPRRPAEGVARLHAEHEFDATQFSHEPAVVMVRVTDISRRGQDVGAIWAPRPIYPAAPHGIGRCGSVPANADSRTTTSTAEALG